MIDRYDNLKNLQSHSISFHHKEHKGYCSFNLLIFYPSPFISFHHKGTKNTKVIALSNYWSIILHLLSHFTTKAQRTQSTIHFLTFYLSSFIFYFLSFTRLLSVFHISHYFINGTAKTFYFA